MNRKSISLLAVFLMSAGVVKSQAPEMTPLASLQTMVEANKGLLDAQKKTLDTLDQLDQDAQQLKIFGKRG